MKKKTTQKTILDRIELRELRKLVRKEIHQDIKNFETSVAEEIIEKNGSTRGAKKQIQHGTP